MSTWPDGLKVGPIGAWPGGLRPAAERRAAPFRATLTATLKQLHKEIFELVDTRAQQESAELLIAIPPGGFRLDGRPRADAKPEHPGVIFSLDSRFGHLSYPCDTFTTWQDNLRAVVLSLEKLRAVDRYGVTKRGEQYRGFLAIEAGSSEPAGFADAGAALDWLAKLTGWTPGVVGNEEAIANERGRLVRDAKRLTHPDLGGDSNDFQRVNLAEKALRAAGML